MTGRPTVFSDEVGAEICRRLVEGDSLRKICGDEEMPAYSSVMLWLAEDKFPVFSENYARARALQGDADADDVGDIARKAAAGKIEPAAATAAINGLKWTAGKRKPKVYGDKQEIEHSGQVTLRDLLGEAKKPE